MDFQLAQVLSPISTIGTFALLVIGFTKALTGYFLRKRMIEKGFVNEDAQAIFRMHTDENKFSALKWGLIIFFGSIPLVLMNFIRVDLNSPFPYGLVAFFISIAFLLYFYLVHKFLGRKNL